MSESSTKAIISGPITIEDAHTLASEAPDSPASADVLQRMGAVADERAVALVVADNGEGESKPSHFVSLHPNDMGVALEPTHARPGAPVHELGLPSPEVAHAELTAQAAAAGQGAVPRPQ